RFSTLPYITVGNHSDAQASINGKLQRAAECRPHYSLHVAYPRRRDDRVDPTSADAACCVCSRQQTRSGLEMGARTNPKIIGRRCADSSLKVLSDDLAVQARKRTFRA